MGEEGKKKTHIHMHRINDVLMGLEGMQHESCSIERKGPNVMRQLESGMRAGYEVHCTLNQGFWKSLGRLVEKWERLKQRSTGLSTLLWKDLWQLCMEGGVWVGEGT